MPQHRLASRWCRCWCASACLLACLPACMHGVLAPLDPLHSTSPLHSTPLHALHSCLPACLLACLHACLYLLYMLSRSYFVPPIDNIVIDSPDHQEGFSGTRIVIRQEPSHWRLGMHQSRDCDPLTAVRLTYSRGRE